MKTTIFSVLAAATAATALMGVSTPAQAFSFNVDSQGLLSVSDTITVNFTFLEGHGAYEGNFGIRDASGNILATLFSETGSWIGNEQNDWLTTAANLTTPSTASYTFVAGTLYQIGVWGPNNGGYYQKFVDARYGEGSYSFKANGPGWGGTPDPDKTLTFNGTIVGFEDGWEKASGLGDGDYNDLIVGIQVPEPMTMGGLALAASGLIVARRRRNNQA